MNFVRNLLLHNQNPAQQTRKSKNTFVICYSLERGLDSMIVHCPRCNSLIGENVSECPDCNVVFSEVDKKIMLEEKRTRAA